MKAIYDSIGDGYDVTRRADPEITAILARLTRVEPDGDYLDIACGTGNYTSALAALGGHWNAIDESEIMLVDARPKSKSVAWFVMDAANIEFPSHSFDGATCTLAIHHFPQITQPFSEVFRVLKPGARFVLFTAFPSQMKKYWLVEYFPKMMSKACNQMPSEEQVIEGLVTAGLELEATCSFEIKPDLEDFFLYSGKQRPEMYLSELVRSGISSFRNGFCSAEELDEGLIRLEQDINSGAISTIMSRYAHNEGDYVFVVARKPE